MADRDLHQETGDRDFANVAYPAERRRLGKIANHGKLHGTRPVDPRPTLTIREGEVLLGLRTDRWQRPMDCGGRDGSDHSRVLAVLACKGCAERRRRGTLTNVMRPNSSRGSYEYRAVATPAKLKQEADEQAHFEKIVAAARARKEAKNG